MKNRTFGFEFECISQRDWSHIAAGLVKLGITVDAYATGEISCRNHCYSGWQVKTDGSISSTNEYPYRVELVSPPLTVDNMKQTRAALRYIPDFSRINSSCGMHVHVGAP